MPCQRRRASRPLPDSNMAGKLYRVDVRLLNVWQLDWSAFDLRSCCERHRTTPGSLRWRHGYRSSPRPSQTSAWKHSRLARLGSCCRAESGSCTLVLSNLSLIFSYPATKKRCACSPRCVRLEELTISQRMTYMNQLIMVSRICWFTLPFIVPAHLCSLTKDTPFCQPNSHNKKKIVQCAHPCEPASVLHSVSISEIMIWVSQGSCYFYLFCFSVDVRLYTSVAMHCFFFTAEYCLSEMKQIYMQQCTKREQLNVPIRVRSSV